jgi:hypothetical protein
MPLQLAYDSPKKTSGGRVPRAAIRLGPGDTKVMKFDLTKLRWNTSISSVWPAQKLFEIAPKGTYDLLFAIETNDGANPEGVSVVSHLVSNKARIEIK